MVQVGTWGTVANQPHQTTLKARWWRRYKPLPPISAEERARLIREWLEQNRPTIIPTNYKPEP